MNWPPNPYPFGMPPGSDESFIDREGPVQRLMEAVSLKERNVLCIVGARRIGKTSLLQRFRRGMASRGLVVDLDLRDLEIAHGSLSSEQGSGAALVVLRDLAKKVYRAAELRGPVPELNESSEFGEVCLQPAFEASRQRVVILLDELDVLEERYPPAIDEILQALLFKMELPALVVCCAGRPLGAPRTATSSYILKSAETISLGLFDKAAMKNGLLLAKMYQFTSQAASLFFEVTGCHPYFANMLSHCLYFQRQLSEDSSDVGPEEIIEAASKAVVTYERGIWNAWLQTGPFKSLLGRAIADLTWQSLENRFSGIATLDQIESYLREHFTEIHGDDLRRSIEGLTRDYILKQEGEGYSLQSPLLGYWLIIQDKADLRLAGDPQAAERLREAREALDNGNRSAALIAIQDALSFDPTHTDALMLAAQIESEQGQLDLAIAHLTTAQRSRPQTVKYLLVEILRQRMQQAFHEGASPASWYYKLLDLVPEEKNSEVLADSVIRYYLERWEESLDVGTIDVANAIFEELASRRFPGWVKNAAERYANVISLVLRNQNLVSCAAAVAHAFPILLTEAIEPIHSEGTGFERDLIAKFEGDPESQHKIRQHLQQYADRMPWWTATISAIASILSRGEPGKGSWVPLEILDEIGQRTPESHQRRFEECIASHLPHKLPELLQFDLLEAVKAVRLLCTSSHMHHQLIQDRLEAHLLELADSDDDKIVAFFRNSAKVYGLWTNFLHPQSEFLSPILDQAELLIQRMGSPRGPVPKDKPEWELFIRAGDGLREWRDFLRHRFFRTNSKAWSLERSLPPPEVDTLAKRTTIVGRQTQYDTLVIDHLRKLYQNPQPLNVSIPGLPKEMVKFYNAGWNGEQVTLKVYRLSPEETSRDFLTYLWENERRALMNLSTRLSGHALTRFKFAEPISKEYLVVVTEPLSSMTLRDYLRQNSRNKMPDPERRQELWTAIQSLVQSIHALHRAHYIHRAIRPESIFVEEANGKLRLKLGNFEFSIYLHSLADEFPKDQRSFDRYTAPEVLARRFHKANRNPGESFCSDVYSLGLLFFELLVRDLSAKELGAYYSEKDYDEGKHEEWLHELRHEVREKLNGSHETDERLLLQEMLEPAVSLRCPDLEDIVQLTTRIAWSSRDIERMLSRQKPSVAATLTRNTATSVENFLRPFVRSYELGSEEEDVARLISEEIAGAHIYRNGGNSEHPLLIDGQRILFAATPFKHRFRGEGTRSDSILEIPYLTVATALDRKEGPPLARLPREVNVISLQAAHVDLEKRHDQTVHRGKAWRRLFELAQTGVERLPAECREFYTILQITAAVEAELWREQLAPYQLADKITDSDQRRIIVIKRCEDFSNLLHKPNWVDRLIARQATRGERFFELTDDSNPLALLRDERVWKLEKIDTTAGTVQMSSLNGPWPSPTGFVRPQSLVGNRAIRQRRSEALEHLRDDEYLLKAVTTVGAVLQKNPLQDLSYFDRSLDEDKKRIVESVLSNAPIHLVQGPPGTGKTTLAAEIIRQTLALNPSARILITAQSHEPLNNLLIRVHKAFEAVDRSQRPAEIRLLSSAKLQSNRWSRQTQETIRSFQPAQVAQDHLQQAKKWQPSGDSRVDTELLAKWRNWLKEKSLDLPRALEQRIIGSANLVYATANDKSISEVPEHREFDLLIFEEAAKAYPLEVLGPMRLSRRWLLIGDHEQLSAFNIEDFRKAAAVATRRQFDLAIGGGDGEQSTTAEGLVAGSDQLAREVADFFEYLFNKGIQHHPQKFADRLSMQWRMHPGVSRLLREIYYPFLRDGDPTQLAEDHSHRVVYPVEFRQHPLIWIDVPPVRGKEESSLGLTDQELAAEIPFVGGGFRNPYEVRVLHNLMSRLQMAGRGGLRGQVAFLSPYKAQVDLINKVFKSWESSSNPHTGDLRQKAFTVDSFQGRQEKVVVVSLVRNNPHVAGFDAYGFLEGEEGEARSAVMFSRAERLLIIIGSSHHFKKQPDFHICRVYEFIQKYGLVVSSKQFLEHRDYQEMRKHQDRRGVRALKSLRSLE